MLQSLVGRDDDGNLTGDGIIPMVDGGTEGFKGNVRLVKFLSLSRDTLILNLFSLPQSDSSRHDSVRGVHSGSVPAAGELPPVHYRPHSAAAGALHRVGQAAAVAKGESLRRRGCSHR